MMWKKTWHDLASTGASVARVRASAGSEGRLAHCLNATRTAPEATRAHIKVKADCSTVLSHAATGLGNLIRCSPTAKAPKNSPQRTIGTKAWITSKRPTAAPPCRRRRTRAPKTPLSNHPTAQASTTNPANNPAISTWAKLALESARARRSAEGAKERSRAASKAKGLGTNLSLPPKLLPSRESGRGSGAELFICEGDSALGTVRSARDATFQAAFPLKGKPPNTFGWTATKARSKEEFESIERILGCGVREHCDPEKSRYDRILFASDADPDGANINSSLISMFLDFYRPLVEAGMVYVTLPPLFVVYDPDTRIYCQDEGERDAAVTKLRAKSKKKVEVQRNKGLGEMNADDFWNTVLDPAQRTVYRISPDDKAEKQERETPQNPESLPRGGYRHSPILPKQPVERASPTPISSASSRGERENR